ncbi:hypothetical protein SALGADO_61 [Arthrobacter phage Salgado]|uniref:Uncharacterized protein n=1 Tax=Arthrobacter phage Salgado TaxID=1772314 RepID=A0A0U4KAE8_9CAUD|nr:hypothetical protein KMD22_gp61 [Arthrobacter phage Salgado]ALY10227.1 hypothetical protein SALGADO_61 [Arthrobacter phage Salgado]
MNEVRPIQSTSPIPTADVRHITKGDVIVEKGGREFRVLSKTPQKNGTFLTTADDPNYLIMVKAEGGRAFDLILTQGMLNRSVYVVTKAGK